MVAAAADAGIERRIDVEIPAGSERMAAWLYSSQKYSAEHPGPAIVLAHGLGATKELRLDVFASKFNELGYTCLVFDYRCNGASTGLPRGLIDWKKQQEDWHTALAFVRAQANVDPESVGIFGTSFGGGHVIQVGATDSRLKAVISQCPFTDGWQSALCTGVMVLPRLFILGVMDRLFSSDQNPHRVALVGAPGESKSCYLLFISHSVDAP
jgi:dipeptidyl aminopeptidase/acylaminoacyl peptidase